MSSLPRFIYHICRKAEWEAALSQGRYAGSSQDVADGFIHFSDGSQVKGFVAEPRAMAGAEDITALGGWRAYVSR